MGWDLSLEIILGGRLSEVGGSRLASMIGVWRSWCGCTRSQGVFGILVSSIYFNTRLSRVLEAGGKDFDVITGFDWLTCCTAYFDSILGLVFLILQAV